MKLQISKGVIAEPQKIVIYGPQGIGKSTLASQFPKPLFLDTERGSRRLSVDRIEITSLADFFEAVTAIQKQPDFRHYQTIVVDTVDWLEAKIKEKVVAQYSAKDRAYDREGSFIGDEMMKLLTELSKLTDIGKHIVLLAHSITAKIDLPDQPAAFDRYELDMNKKHVAPLIKHWGDALFFLRWKLKIRQVDEGKNKGVGGEERLLCCSQSAAYDAKNRYALDGEHPCDTPETTNCGNALAIIRSGFEKVGAPWAKESQGSVTVAHQATPIRPVEERSQAMGMKAESENGRGAGSNPAPETHPQEKPNWMKKKEMEAAQSKQTDGIPGLAPENGGPSSDQLALVLEGHEAKALTWLRARGRITPEQTLADVPKDTRDKILANPARFIETINAAAV